MNIDFSHHAGFSCYVLLLMFSGAVMVAMGSPAVRVQSRLLRVLNVAFGLGFFGYGFYLAFLFQGGSYLIFFKAFVLPVVLIVRTVRGARARPARTSDRYVHPELQRQRAGGQWTPGAQGPAVQGPATDHPTGGAVYAPPAPVEAPAFPPPVTPTGERAPAGYYPNPDPSDGHSTRWWDGDRWVA